MKIAVTGATGLLGNYLCRSLTKRGHQVTALRRAESNTRLLTEMEIEYALGDVTDGSSLESAFRGHEVVFHAAAHLAYWSRERERQDHVNIQGTRNVIAACQSAGVRRLVFVSSIAAIGFPERGMPPADESFPFNLEHGKLNYAVTKKRAEEYVLASCKNGFDAVIVNPATLFGSLGDRYRGSEWINKVRGRRFAFYYSGGRNMVHVADVAQGMISAMERGRTGERYILGGENLTYKAIAQQVAARFGQRITLVPVLPLMTGVLSFLDPLISLMGRRPPVTREVHFTASRFQFYSSAKAVQELGYSYRPFSAIIEDILEWNDQRINSVS